LLLINNIFYIYKRYYTLHNTLYVFHLSRLLLKIILK